MTCLVLHRDSLPAPPPAPPPDGHPDRAERWIPTGPGSLRRIRDRLHRFVRSSSPRAGARSCLVDPIAGIVRVRVDATTGRPHLSGLARCGSPWSCPVCSPTVRHRRAVELTALTTAVLAEGGSAVMVTLTIPHRHGDRLADLLDGLQASWSGLTSGGWWTRFRDRHELAGLVRVVEITHSGRAGWHPHLHVLMVSTGPSLDAGAMWLDVLPRWAATVERHLGARPDLRHGVDVRPVEDPAGLGEYVADSNGWSVGAELASGPSKLGRHDSVSPFQLLAAGALWGDAAAADLWHEYEAATAGRRPIRASPGLMDRYRVEEQSDEAAAEGPTVETALCDVEIEPAVWVLLAALDLATEWVDSVAVWAVAGCHGPPPDPLDLALAELASRNSQYELSTGAW